MSYDSDHNYKKNTSEAFYNCTTKVQASMALSGGQKQRLAIVTGVLSDKKILIFDEPTSGLDLEHMVAVSQTIKKLSKNGHIILIITHDKEFLDCTCTKVFTLKGSEYHDL